MSGKHTPEPWKMIYYGPDEKNLSYEVCSDNAELTQIAETGMNERGKENARRIVACINACKGWDTETLEESNAKGITLRETVDTLVMDILSGGRK